MEFGGLEQSRITFFVAPLIPRYHREWCHLAQCRVTVPRVIARKVPGVAVVGSRFLIARSLSGLR